MAGVALSRALSPVTHDVEEAVLADRLRWVGARRACWTSSRPAAAASAAAADGELTARARALRRLGVHA